MSLHISNEGSICSVPALRQSACVNSSLMLSAAALVWQGTQPVLIHACHLILNVVICEVLSGKHLSRVLLMGLRGNRAWSTAWTFCGEVLPLHNQSHRSSLGHWEWQNGNPRLTQKQTEESLAREQITPKQTVALRFHYHFGRDTILNPNGFPSKDTNNRPRQRALGSLVMTFLLSG